MTENACPTCGSLLPEPDSHAVLRCAACGAPQVRLSEELQREAQAQRERYEEALAKGALPDRSPAEVDWKKALLFAAGGAIATVGMCALLPPLTTLAWLAPLPVLLGYRLRFPQAAITPLAGARIGAAVGLLGSALAALLGTAYLVVLRFGLHRLRGFDALYAAALAAAGKQAVAQEGASAAASSAVLALPEFRAGMLLLFGLLAAGAFVLLCVACGALTAAAGRRRSARQAG